MTHSHDTIQRFMFEHADIRGQIVHLNQSYREIMEQHQYPNEVARLLGEALVAVTLLTAVIKFEGNLTLQFQSDGPIKMLVAKCNHTFDLRGLAQWDQEKLAQHTEQHTLLGRGKLIVTISQDNVVNAYQSVIALEDNSISDALELYFANSEQLSTKIWLAIDDQQAAGMLLQLMPEKNSADREEFWRHALVLGESLTPNEMLTLDNITILRRLYHQEELRIFDAKPVRFHCTCSHARMENAIRTLGKDESENLLSEKQVIDVTCDFCSRHYTFDRIDVAKIFEN